MQYSVKHIKECVDELHDMHTNKSGAQQGKAIKVHRCIKMHASTN